MMLVFLGQVTEILCLGQSIALEQNQTYLNVLILLLDGIIVAVINPLSLTLPLAAMVCEHKDESVHETITLHIDETTSCEDGEVRLEGGFSDSNGRVEFCQYRTWGAVCSEGWDDSDARVVCGQLGYSSPEGIHGHF